ncbi:MULTISPECIES: lipoprotein [unclassified Anaerobiospirillum]|uniref:LPS translocon maturation chaperone LptM n=1 Tax=unclassified Anaerobiospirillum TaxID=2647410 RepID=UPI001FF42F44|nr:lipoprotein [Anaerobiospirillum sp. NML120511]MCK0539002.1 lipoprotein [Anaerobiospirillum sp. NML02-A-032]
MNRLSLIAGALCAAIFMAGCGLKGDLYMPEPAADPAPAPAQAPAAAPAAADSAEPDEASKD